MRRADPRRRRPGRRRPAYTLVLFALLLPLLFGMLGLIVDGGLVMAALRLAQNAADAAAMTASMERVRGKTAAASASAGTSFVKDATYNNLPGATVVMNIPPLSGPHAGDVDYVEAIVTLPLRTTFIQVLGINPNQQVRARAVAGFQSVAAGEGAIALDRNARPGLSIGGGGQLIVNGGVIVNSEFSGLDENYQIVNPGIQQFAATTGNNAKVKCTDIYVAGGVDIPGNFVPYITGDHNPLHAGLLPRPDPLKNVPVPRAGIAGVTTTYRGAFQASTGTHTLNPGIYDSIKISNNANVTFNPGMYILKPPSNVNNSLSITGGGVVRGTGVMFYNTGNNFDINTGLPDANDGENAPPITDGASFGDITLNGSNTQLSGLIAPLSPFDGLLIFQRRRNTKSADIQGNGTNTKLEGTIYAKWANFKLAGSAQYDAQFVIGTIAVSGNANITFNYAGKNLARANQVFLVE